MHVRGPRFLALALACAALALVSGRPSAQQRSVVRGRVEIGIPVKTRRPGSSYGTRSLPAKPLAPPSEVRNVVVFLKDAPARSTAPAHAEIHQQNETFVPHVVAIPVGSVVDFPNDDSIYHNVFSLSKAKSFNLGRYPKGETRPVKFDKAGVVKVFCDIHSHMSATVIVFNHPWYAIPDDDGRFELPDVPPGDHQITAWHERLGDTTMKVHVDAGRAAVADFTLPVPPK